MTAQELIKTLEGIAPETVVKVGTSAGVFAVEDVRTSGYTGGVAVIVADD